MTRNVWIAWGLVVLFAVAGGCKTTKKSKDNHEAAKGRWNSTRSGIMHSLAQNQFENGELEKAEKTIGQAMATSPDRPEHYELAAQVHIELGKLELAFRLLEQSMKLDANRSDTHYLMGVVQERWQRYEQALAGYGRAFELRPDDVMGLLASAQVLVKLDRLGEAEARLAEKADYFENNAALQVELGQVRMLRGNHAGAAHSFREASLLQPEDGVIVEYMVDALIAGGDHAGAVEPLTRLLGMPGYAGRDDLRLVLGDSEMATGRATEARGWYAKIVERNPRDVNGWIRLGQASMVTGDDAGLFHAAKRVIELAPERSEGFVLLGMAQQKAGMHREAIARFEEASRLSPNSVEPLLLKGISLEKCGERTEAEAAYRAAMKINPNDERAGRLLEGVRKGEGTGM